MNESTRTRVTIHGPEGIAATIEVARGPNDAERQPGADELLDRLLGEDQADDENALTRQPEGEG